MTIAEQYARALRSLVEHNPAGASGYIQNLKRVMARRGHRTLLPRVFSAYGGLELASRRARAHERTTPAGERTRVLLQLYKKLIATQ